MRIDASYTANQKRQTRLTALARRCLCLSLHSHTLVLIYAPLLVIHISSCGQSALPVHHILPLIPGPGTFILILHIYSASAYLLLLKYSGLHPSFTHAAHLCFFSLPQTKRSANVRDIYSLQDPVVDFQGSVRGDRSCKIGIIRPSIRPRH